MTAGAKGVLRLGSGESELPANDPRVLGFFENRDGDAGRMNSRQHNAKLILRQAQDRLFADCRFRARYLVVKVQQSHAPEDPVGDSQVIE